MGKPFGERPDERHDRGTVFLPYKDALPGVLVGQARWAQGFR
jgi:hypothetical protein